MSSSSCCFLFYLVLWFCFCVLAVYPPLVLLGYIILVCWIWLSSIAAPHGRGPCPLTLWSRFLRRFRSHLTRSLSIVKSELGPTQGVWRTDFWCPSSCIFYPFENVGKSFGERFAEGKAQDRQNSRHVTFRANFAVPFHKPDIVDIQKGIFLKVLFHVALEKIEWPRAGHLGFAVLQDSSNSSFQANLTLKINYNPNQIYFIEHKKVGHFYHINV